MEWSGRVFRLAGGCAKLILKKILYYFNRIINNRFVIDNNQINPLKFLFILIIILTSFILLNFYPDKIINLLSDYNIFKKLNYSILFIVILLRKGDNNFNNKEKRN